MRVVDRFTEWLDMPDGRIVAAAALTPPIGGDVVARRGDELVDQLRKVMRTEAPVWCDPAAVDMLGVMACQLPEEELERPLLLAPAGMVVFARDLPVEWSQVWTARGGTVLDEGPTSTAVPLRAVSWQTTGDAAGEVTLVQGWQYREPGIGTVAGRYVRMRELWPSVLEVWGGPGVDRPGDRSGATQRATRLLYALAALARSPMAACDDGEVRLPGRRRPEGRGPVAPVRRLYLRRPEMGARELEELRAERAGTPPAGHWVRGHWKRQWYASMEDHRLMWIEGYPRGDWARGKIDGPAVLVARGDRADTGESRL